MAEQWVECQHAIRDRASGKTPALADWVVSLGQDAADNEVLLHVCCECWQRITGMVLADVMRAGVRDAVKGQLAHGR